MPKTRRAPCTVLELCIVRGGVIKGSRVAAFVAQWAIASQALGRPITLADYCDWWAVPESTGFRHQAECRQVFPNMPTPQPLADAAIKRADEWLAKGVRGIGALPADIVPGALIAH